MLKGTWQGTYSYESKRLPPEEGARLTDFLIEITDFDGLNFNGTVEDDIDTGGTRGMGKIEGKLSDNKISFIKRMPVLTYKLPDGQRVEENRSHPKIYYCGTFVNDQFIGEWKIRFGIRRINNRLALFFPTKGKWEMKRSS